MGLQDIAERVKRRPVLSASVAVFLGVTAFAEIDGYNSNRTYDRPGDSCVSPFIVSNNHYRDPNTNTLLMADTGIATTGVIARTHLQGGVYGVQVGYENPKADGSDWHISKMIKANSAGNISVKLAIGTGKVHFGVRTVAPQDSFACRAAPNTSFVHLDRSDYFRSPGQLPWPNPVNVITHELHGLG